MTSPRRSTRTPSYRLHRPTGQAVVTINGRDRYLGKHGSPESKAEYDRLIAEWLAAGRSSAPTTTRTPATVTVNEIWLAYYRHAEGYYRTKDGQPTQELNNVVDAIKPVRRLYGEEPAVQFGPLALRAARDAMIRSGLARNTINARVHRVRRMFRWAASVQLIPGSVVVDLETVEALAEGRTQARETEEIQPVPLETVEATLPFLSAQVRAMVQVQLLSGCRPSEVMGMRGCDLKMGESHWEYRPARHKNAWRGHKRVITLGPRAVAIVREWLRTDPNAYLFDPREAVAAHHERRRKTRRSKATPSELGRRVEGTPGAKVASRYDRRGYRQAVVRACDRAFPHPVEAELMARKKAAPTGQRRAIACELTGWRHTHRDELKAWRKAHRWNPLQLRHTAATEIRDRFGLEAASVVLGHSKPDTTLIYALAKQEKAKTIMEEVG